MNIDTEIEKYVIEIKQTLKEKKINAGINLNTKQAAQIVGVSQSTLEQWRRNGIGVDYILAGKRVLYPIRELARFIVLRQVKSV